MKSNTPRLLLTLLSCNRWPEDANTRREWGRSGIRAFVYAAAGLFHAAAISVMLAGAPSASEPTNDWVQQVEFANALVDSGDLEEAQRVYTRAMIHAQTAGDKVRVGVVLLNVGRLLDRKGQLREAEKTYLRAVSAFSAAGEADGRLAVRAYVGLNAVYIQTGRYAKAETLIRRVLADHSAGDPDKVSLLGSLGVVLAHRQKLAEAEQVLRQTAELCAGDQSTDMQEIRAVAIANMAGIQNRVGRTREAVASYSQALSIMETLPHPSPTTISVTLGDYADVVARLGDRGTAAGLYSRAINIAESRLGPGHPILGTLLQKYSELLRRSGNKAEARTVANAARRIEEQARLENLTGHTIPVEALMVNK